MNRIERITAMEKNLDASAEAIRELSAALEKYESAQTAWKKLCEYYGGTQWMRDYEADEAGKLPADLKRGVLSEDTVYDLIIENRDMIMKMLELARISIRDGIM